MKLENLLLGQDYRLKISDFGIAGPAAGRDSNGTLTSVEGSNNYKAPEILLKQPYSGQSIDIFSCGVILFMMVNGSPPFRSAAMTDHHYKMISEKDFE